ncbi:MAG: magnesium/cobalt transporter CorA [Candidatus Bathyarchaeota archaeon]
MGSYRFNLDKTLSLDLSRNELLKIRHSPKEMFWVDIEAPTESDLKLMSEVLNFHPLAIEDCIHEQTRPKIDDYEGYKLIVFHGINFNPGEHRLDTIDLKIFLGSNYIVTVHDKTLQSIAVTKSRLEKNPQLLETGPDRILYRILDELVDRYFSVINDLDEKLTKIENNIFETFSKESLQQIFSSKKEVLALKKLVSPQMEVLKTLTYRESPYISPSTQLYLRDVYDHMLRIFDTLENQRDLLSTTMDSYLSQVSNRMNEVMKALSIVATIMLPLSFLTGLYGTNFILLPGAEDPLGFWLLIAGMISVAGVMVMYFRRKKWF